jgi:Protein of unknown function (DUF3800)
LKVYCDESGGVGRGVMTLAAVSITPAAAEELLARFRADTGLVGELKGSRIDLAERAQLIELFAASGAQATIGIAISAVKPEPGEDRGDHDRMIYAALLEDVIASLLPAGGDCMDVVIDDGRYDQATLTPIRADVAALLGPCGFASLALSHRSAGLQIADVIANTFFNRAMVTTRQARFADLVASCLASGQMQMRVLDRLGPNR